MTPLFELFTYRCVIKHGSCLRKQRLKRARIHNCILGKHRSGDSPHFLKLLGEAPKRLILYLELLIKGIHLWFQIFQLFLIRCSCLQCGFIPLKGFIACQAAILFQSNQFLIDCCLNDRSEGLSTNVACALVARTHKFWSVLKMLIEHLEVRNVASLVPQL